jgi:RNA polymerase sigma factor (sigma-70 family)
MPDNGTSNPFDPLRRFFPRLKAGDPSVRKEIADELMMSLPDVVRPRFHKKFPRLRTLLQTDDVVQDVMLRLVQALFNARPETEDEFVARIWQAIPRTLTDLVRKHYGPRGDGRNARIGVPELGDAETTDHRATRDVRLDIRDLVADLPMEDAELIMARYYMDLEVQQIAAMYGVDRSTVGRRLNRITGHLADRLKD